ncbi:MAG: transcriptional regulator [Candidatus Rokubacteria bacterium GWA2_70_23]|nr:MAG: transcriptional regulator [Candidatus Rokubacteria bacterium GWA2_70_23]
MPIISVFFGIVIRMFYREHEPAHFHAEHQGQQGKFDLKGKMIAGNIRSRTALRLIREWASLRGRELEADWENMKAGRPLERIEPLQ